MDRRAFLLLAAGALGAQSRPAPAAAAEGSQPIPLPPPQTDGGLPLLRAVRTRRSARSFRPEPLSPQVLSNLLWAAFGVNRPESGGRTAPSANNAQDMGIYLAAADGLSRYEAKVHALMPLLAEDIRGLTGRQAFAREAPLNLIYVSDLSKMVRASAEMREFYAAAHTGFIGQNVYLYCASEGLATVVRALVDREPLAARLGLRADQRITLVQSVGYPRT
jgi:nitroreductase